MNENVLGRSCAPFQRVGAVDVTSQGTNYAGVCFRYGKLYAVMRLNDNVVYLIQYPESSDGALGR